MTSFVTVDQAGACVPLPFFSFPCHSCDLAQHGGVECASWAFMERALTASEHLNVGIR